MKKKLNKKLLFMSLILACLVGGCISDVNNIEKQETKEVIEQQKDFEDVIDEEQTQIDETKYCEKDEDCITVQDGCCACGEEGKNTAINKNFKNYWEIKLSIDCKHIACLQSISDHWTCISAMPKCINNQCKIVPKEA